MTLGRTTRTKKVGARKRSGKPANKPAHQSVAESVEAQLRAIERGDGEGELDFGRGVMLHVSSLNKVYFPYVGVTKGALMRYYAHTAPVLLPQIKGRPLVLKRYPDGVAGPMFFSRTRVRTSPMWSECKHCRRRRKASGCGSSAGIW